ncbi:MAG: Uma2 family endonuclease [Gemmataceae bacterium]
MVIADEMIVIKLPTVETHLETIAGTIDVPGGIADLATFRTWINSSSYPNDLRIDFIKNSLWLDASMEELLSHNQMKMSMYHTLIHLVVSESLGMFLPDGMRISHPSSGLSVEPDAAFVSFDALQTGRVRKCVGPNGIMELEGSPEMVLEVVSRSSRKKDYEQLPELYAASGVQEFWRVDVRTDVSFEILHLVGSHYNSASSDSEGYVKSNVYGRFFRIVKATNAIGDPVYVLEHRR